MSISKLASSAPLLGIQSLFSTILFDIAEYRKKQIRSRFIKKNLLFTTFTGSDECASRDIRKVFFSLGWDDSVLLCFKMGYDNDSGVEVVPVYLPDKTQFPSCLETAYFLTSVCESVKGMSVKALQTPNILDTNYIMLRTSMPDSLVELSADHFWATSKV